MAGAVRGGGHTWQRGMRGRRAMCGWEDMHGRRVCMPRTPPGRYYEIQSMSGWYRV